MQFEVEKDDEYTEIITSVNVVPSHPDSLFIVRHYHYGVGAVGKIGLAGLDKADIDRIDSGEVTPKDLFMMEPGIGAFARVESAFVPFASIEVPGSDKNARMALEYFQEMEPADLQ